MNKKNIIYIIIFFLIIFTFLYFKYLKKEKVIKIESQDSEEFVYNSNIIENVNYNAKDSKGNEYIINAIQGEIDINNSDVIYLTNVVAYINLNTQAQSKFIQDIVVNLMDNKTDQTFIDKLYRFFRKESSIVLNDSSKLSSKDTKKVAEKHEIKTSD